MAGGRPLKFKTPAILKKKITSFFTKAERDGEPFLITSLCVDLGISRETLAEYGGEVPGRLKGKDPEIQAEFAGIIKIAKEKCSDWLYKNALQGKVNNTMAIFGLKANHKWRDHDNDIVVVNNNVEISPEKLKAIKATINKNK